MPSNQLYLSFYYSFPVMECSIKISLHLQDSRSITFTMGLCSAFCRKYIFMCTSPSAERKGKKILNNLAGFIFVTVRSSQEICADLDPEKTPSLSSTPSCSYKTQLLTGSETSYGTPALSITLLLHPNNLHPAHGTPPS